MNAKCNQCGLTDQPKVFMHEAEGTDEPAICPVCGSKDIEPPEA